MLFDHRSTRLTKLLYSLPPLPRSVEKLLALPEATTPVRQFVELIESEPRLASKVLRLANSSYHALSTPISTVRQAVPLLGIRTVKSLALSASATTILEHPTPVLDLVRFWRHALVVGFSGYKIAEALKLPGREEIYLAGLIHDIGLGFLIQHFTFEFAKFARKGIEGLVETLQWETEEFGHTHPEVSAWMAERWRLPRTVRDGARYHHAPEGEMPRDIPPEADQVAGVVKVADGYARRTGHWISDYDSLPPSQPLPPFRGRTFTLSEIDGMVGAMVSVMAEIDVLFSNDRSGPLEA